MVLIMIRYTVRPCYGSEDLLIEFAAVDDSEVFIQSVLHACYSRQVEVVRTEDRG